MTRIIQRTMRLLGAAMLLAVGLAGVIGMRAGRPDASDWRDRLEALRPDQPLAYFELAEEIADVASDREELALARRLFGLAGVLDPHRLGRSASLALAELETTAHARQRLLALAMLLDNRGGVGLGPIGADAEVDPAAALGLSEAFSYYRQGNGPRALKVLEDSGAMPVLEAHDRFVRGGIKRFIEDCKNYRGQLRPMLGELDIDRMLQLERSLLSGADRDWASELQLTDGAPLAEVDPDRLDTSLGVDATKPIYRDGHWVPLDDAAPRSR